MAQEDENDRVCRICFDGDGDDEKGELLAPCYCNGTSKFIHERCLDDWRKSSPVAFNHCPTCNYVWKTLPVPWYYNCFNNSKFLVVITILILYIQFILFCLITKYFGLNPIEIIMTTCFFYTFVDIFSETAQDMFDSRFHFESSQYLELFIPHLATLRGFCTYFSFIYQRIKLQANNWIFHFQPKIMNYHAI